MDSRNATAAVIGAGDYIGAAIAKKFAAEGFTIFAGRRNGGKLAPLVADIEAQGPTPLPMPIGSSTSSLPMRGRSSARSGRLARSGES
jgi:NAD(P)-dependent dehydrogenase (short-subunit alcohol dehydrogenase family)